jgi:hypothetical protein
MNKTVNMKKRIPDKRVWKFLPEPARICKQGLLLMGHRVDIYE